MLLPSHRNTRHCLRIHVTLTEETEAAPPPPHAWTVLLVEDMLCYGRTGLTEAIVTGLGRAVLFYGRPSMGEGLRLGEVTDGTFTLTGAGTWVGKPAYLPADPLTIQEGWWTIDQAVTEARGPGQPHLHPLTLEPCRFYHPGDFPWKDCQFWPSTITLQAVRGWDHNQCRRDQRVIPPQPPSPSLDHRFESDRS